jgi:hypothetical protein
MHRSAQKRIAVLREAAAIEQYEQMQPQLDAIDEAYRGVNSTMTEEQWRAARADVRAQFNVNQTLAGAEYERDFVNRVEAAAQSRIDEATALEVSTKLDQVRNKFDGVMTAYSKGEASQADALAAQQQLQQDTAAIRQEYDIPLDADDEVRQNRSVLSALRKALEARTKYDDEQMDIDTAEISGTLSELPAKLQQRAVEAHKAGVTRELDELVQSGQLSGEDMYTEYDKRMADYYARTGAIDPTLERTMNGFLSGGLVDKNGEPRAEYIEAAEQYRLLLERNPDVADRYVRPENQAMLDAVMDVAAGGALAGAVRTVGVRQAPPYAASTEEIMSNGMVQRGIEFEVDKYLSREDIGFWQATFDPATPENAQLNQPEFDLYSALNRSTIQSRIEASVAEAHAREPLARPSELVTAAANRVRARTPILGGIAVPLPMNGPSMDERMFGARAADMADVPGAYNAAIMDHFRSPEFVDRYPFATQRTLGEQLVSGITGAVHSGVRPFQSYYDSKTDTMYVQFELPSGGGSAPIALDLRTIGRNYINKHTTTETSRPSVARPITRATIFRERAQN